MGRPNTGSIGPRGLGYRRRYAGHSTGCRKCSGRRRRGCGLVSPDIGCQTQDAGRQEPLPQRDARGANRAAAEAAKGPGATVVEALDQVWLFTIGAAGVRTPGGKHIAEIGPLPVKSSTKYTAQYMEAIFPPVPRPDRILIRGPKRGTTPPGACAWRLRRARRSDGRGTTDSSCPVIDQCG
jgi:hypothetical protein